MDASQTVSTFVQGIDWSYVGQRAAWCVLWTAIHSVFYWAGSFAIFGLERLRGVPESEREGARYAPTKRARIHSRVLFNQWVPTPIFFFGLSFLIDAYRPHAPGLNWPLYASVPLSVISVDYAFYALHWVAHQPYFFSRVHFVHHEITTAYAPAAAYCHWAEQIFVNLTSGIPAPFFFGFTDVAIALWIAAGTLDVVVAHSRHSTEHFTHHRLKKVQFGSTLTHVDRVAGTREVAKRDEALKDWTK